ncbi:hypothetical protein LSAT2_023080 [Lamellibrachia satsuma]|nr:hypothetical protein LSAT2_023080 [Lamellibrachia satsuma]
MTPPMSVPFLQGPFEESMVLVSGLSPTCTGDDLKTFFSEQDTHSEIQCVTFSLKPGVAMLQFIHPPEFDRLREICVTKPLRGTMLSLQKMPQSKTIQAHNIGDVTEDILTLFFESRRSGGGELANIQVCRKDDYALLEFLEIAPVQNILAKENHTVQTQALCVSTYYDCLGLTPPHHDTTIPGGWIPKNVVVKGFCPLVLSFLQSSIVSRELVNSKMAELEKYPLRMLNVKMLKSEQEKRFLRMNVTIDEDKLEVKFHGNEPDLKAAEVAIYDMRKPDYVFFIGRGTTGNPECVYWTVCHRYVQTLKIQENLVDSAFNTCYCSQCHSARKDKDYYDRGKPAKTYGIPVGWCRIGLQDVASHYVLTSLYTDVERTPPQAKAHDSFATWHRAFHGTKPEYVAPILAVGHLLVPGDVALGGKKIGERPGHFSDERKPARFNTKKVFLSPSILYAGCDVYATPSSYVDKQTKKGYESRVAFQVLIAPDIYEVGAQTIGARHCVDRKFSNNELEWSTEQRGSIIVYGLLVRLEETRK